MNGYGAEEGRTESVIVSGSAKSKGQRWNIPEFCIRSVLYGVGAFLYIGLRLSILNNIDIYTSQVEHHGLQKNIQIVNISLLTVMLHIKRDQTIGHQSKTN